MIFQLLIKLWAFDIALIMFAAIGIVEVRTEKRAKK